MIGQTSRRRSGIGVAAVNGGIALALILLIATVALVVKPPAPPGIAEFAPQAAQAIQHAPPSQAGQFGGGSAGCSAGTTCTGGTGKGAGSTATATTTPAQRTSSGGTPLPPPGSPPIQGVPSALQCYTWPNGSVTQTFDPQSPPCVATWNVPAGNGGATTPGVTGTEIRVAFPEVDGTVEPIYQDMVNFVNSHYELYGRKFVLVPINESSVESPDDIHAEALQAAAQNVFASTSNEINFEPAGYNDTLAEHHVISISADVDAYTSSEQQQFAPYEWSYTPPLDVVEGNLGEFVCNALVGHLADHGGPDVATKPRKFAIMLEGSNINGSGVGGTPDEVTILSNRLAACGSPAKVVIFNPPAGPQGAADPSTQAQFLQLQQQGYTSIIVFSEFFSQVEGPYAENIGYNPEWIVPGYGIGYREDDGSGNAAEMVHTFELETWNKFLPWAEEPWYESANTVDPGVDTTHGEPLTYLTIYESLLMLASGVQMAGPHLTPATFEKGLQSTTFPNPGAGQSPFWQATVGFPGGTHYMMNDLGLVWYNPTGTSYYNAATPSAGGGWCYVDKGQRWSAGTWPHADPGLFDASKGC